MKLIAVYDEETDHRIEFTLSTLQAAFDHIQLAEHHHEGEGTPPPVRYVIEPRA